MSRILIVEDERHLADGLRFNLEAESHLAEVVESGEAALVRLTEEPAIEAVVLDVMLPGIDGFAVATELRKRGQFVPVLMLTARGAPQDVLRGFAAGADDYLPKPFRMEELIARVRALIRRSAGHGAAVIEAGGVSLDTRQMRVAVDGIPVTLSALEYRLVAYLLHHRGRVIPASELIEHLYGDDARDANALEAIIARLRRKLGADTIETRRGFGYCIPDTAQ
jgi:two-component system, OmpR family, response regulator